MENAQIIIGEDGESDLPEEIIHHILSRLLPRDAARSTLLSKSWHRAWCTRPNLRFDQSMFRNRVDDEFPIFTKKTMQRYEDLNLNIKSFKLTINEEYQDQYDSLVRELILKAIKLGATDLTIHVPTPPSFEGLESETLARLSVVGDVTRAPHFDVGAMIKLHKLEYLRLKGLDIKDSLCRHDLWPQFPCLKELVIVDEFTSDYKWDDVRICSPSLERISIRLYPCRNVVNAEFDVPNIRYFKFKFEYEGEIPLLKFRTRDGREWESDIHIECGTRYSSRYITSASRLSSLRQLVRNLSSSRISLFIFMRVDYGYGYGYRYVGDGLAIHVVENLTLEGFGLTRAFMDGLLRICCPNFINVQRRYAEIVDLKVFRQLKKKKTLLDDPIPRELLRFQRK